MAALSDAVQTLTLHADAAPVPPAASAAAASAPAPAAASSGKGRVLNVNVGILGHVDSGKTSLAKALSTLLSTASLDKLPQSQARGITLDLGFSAFFLPVPASLRSRYDTLQITLVDCPGHASLIRTIIGGACIIDLMLLVLDSQKLIQTQTAECMVIGEILAERLIVVLNKVDLLKEPEKQLPKIEKQLRTQVFAATKFGKDLPIVAVAANPGSVDDLKIKEGASSAATAAGRGAAAASSAVTAAASSSSAAATSAEHAPQVQPLIDALSAALNAALPQRLQVALDPAAAAAAAAAPFLFAVDHCFQMKGSGTVLTGTVLQGKVSVNQTVELPGLKVEKKVKSMQRFRQPIDTAVQGDRVGICVTQLDASLIERGLLCAPGSVQSYDSVIAVVEKVRFYKGIAATKSKFHISIGHATATATAHFFGGPMHMPAAAAAGQSSKDTAAAGTATKGKKSGGKTPATDSAAAASSSASAAATSSPASTAAAAPSGPMPPSGMPPLTPFDWDRDYSYREELLASNSNGAAAAAAADVTVPPYTQFAVLEFDKPVQAPLNSLLLASRLDGSVRENSCRIVFSGRLLTPIRFTDPMERAKLRVIKRKVREGVVDRVIDSNNLIGRDLFGRDTDMSPYTGRKITLETTGAQGVIEGAFGQGGKFRAHFDKGIGIDVPVAHASESDASASAAPGKKAKGPKAPTLKGKILLHFKKYVYALDKKQIVQD